MQLTPEARVAIERADETLFLLADPGSVRWIQGLRPDARSLHSIYRAGRQRTEIYEEIVEEVLASVRAGRRVCAALYGHPGVSSFLGHEAVRRARAEGFAVEMLPAVSAEDCLYADLGLDPGKSGCQTYEATDFVVYRRRVDTSAALVLLQVTAVGSWRAETEPNREGLRVLAEYLRELYPANHQATLYEASPYPVADPSIRPVRLDGLESAELGALATLYVPPARSLDPDPRVLERLGISSG